MRSVPHRVVCLLGLDDGVFPRKAPRDGDDLMLDDPHVGDRDPRTEDRQLLLDALLAATDRLIVTYTGNDERTNLAAPPAVPVGELLDVVDRTVAGGGAARRSSSATRCSRSTRATSRPASSCRDRAVELRPRHARRRARARRPSASEPAPFLAGPLPPLDGDAGRARRPRALRRAPGRARSCASGSASASATSPTRSTTRCRSSSTASSSGASASGCSTRGSPASSARARDPGRDRARHAAAGRARQAGDRARCGRPSRRSSRAALPDAAAPGSVDVKVALPDGRPLSGTVRRRRAATCCARSPTRA